MFRPDALAPPFIDPTSGIYRPPLVVTISAAPADGAFGDDSTVDSSWHGHLYYAVQRAATAADVSGPGAAGLEPPPQRYRGAFTLSEPGRVKVRAFVRRVGARGEIVDGPSATALYMLDRVAQPPNRKEHGSLLHLVRHPAPAVNVTTLKAAMANGSLDTNQIIASNKRFLQFVEMPQAVRSFETFSVTLFLVDGCGFPVALPETNPVVSLTAEATYDDYESDHLRRHHTAPSDAATVVKIPCNAMPTDNSPVPVHWTQVINMLSVGQGSLHRIGDSTAWDAWATCRPTIALRGANLGVQFCVANPCRGIIGLHPAQVDPGSRGSWRLFTHSIHLSADTDDRPNAACFFRLYENGFAVDTVGTKSFDVGAVFSMKLRPNGAVVYILDGCVIHVSSTAHDGSVSDEPLAVSVKLASQVAEPALQDVGLLRAETPSLIQVSNLLWRSAPQVEDAQQSEVRRMRDRALQNHDVSLVHGGRAAQRIPRLLIRGWIAGSEHVPATATIPLVESPIPRWALGATSLAAMFALGAFGCQGGHVGQMLLQHNAPGLVVVPGVAPAVVGRWLSPTKALRMPAERHTLQRAPSPPTPSQTHQGYRQSQQQRAQDPNVTPSRNYPLAHAATAAGGGAAPFEDDSILSPQPWDTPKLGARPLVRAQMEQETPVASLRDLLRSRGF
jgi:hypothetical protein